MDVRRGMLTKRGGAVVLLAALGLGAAACGGPGSALSASHDHAQQHHVKGAHRTDPPTTTLPRGTTTTSSAPASSPPSPTTDPVSSSPPPAAPHGPVTEPPLPAPGPGFARNEVTAIGDSVMIDYEGSLAEDIPGLRVTASVGRWWTTGESILRQLKSEDTLGAVVIIGLGTNGPISAAQFDSMMTVLAGASRVVFVNERVDRTWQDPNNAVLAQGVAKYPRAVLVNWYSLAVQNPGWFYTTQTHLPIDGPGAQALAALVAAAA